MYKQEQQIAELFGTYFHQNCDLMVKDFDDNKPIVPQLVQAYKENSQQEDINEAASEVEDLIRKHYNANILDELFTELGIEIDIMAHGYTYQQFLIEVLKLLKE